MRAVYVEARRRDLHNSLSLVWELIRDDVAAGRHEQVNLRIRPLRDLIGCRITVIDADGTVLADNQADPAQMANHLNRPEIVAAARAGEAERLRSSATIHESMLYLARRLDAGQGRPCFVRLAVPVRDLNEELRMLYGGVLLAALAALAMAVGVAYALARRQARRVGELTRLAEAVSRGEFHHRIARSGHDADELATLGAALDRMAASIQELLGRSESERTEVLAILASLSEGIIVTDARQTVRLANGAAGELLGFAAGDAPGKALWQVVRTDWVIRAAREVLETGGRRAFAPSLIGNRHVELSLSVYPMGLQPRGLILVAHDATPLVRLQEMRKDFVANASHELRTPLAVIRGYVETLREGAIHDPVKGPRYLEIIERHSAQLANLVDDLLSLSRLESFADVPRRQRVDVAAAIHKVLDLLGPAAAARKHDLAADIQPAPAVAGDPDYIERAISNLVDNAIKYTPEGGHIRVALRSAGDDVIIEVSDNGVGIPPEDLTRIFERFYRVDRSRSRELGGTGLGLSIVKHVAQLHGGSVEAESTLGRGSTFRMRLPAMKPA